MNDQDNNVSDNQNEDSRRWLRLHIEIEACIHHVTFSKLSKKLGHNANYINELVYRMSKPSVQHLLKDMPFLSNKNIKKIERGNNKPVYKSLRRYSYQINGRRSFTQYVVFYARAHKTTVGKISTAVRGSRTVLSHALNGGKLKNMISVCNVITSYLHTAPTDLTEPFRRAYAQGYNDRKEHLLKKVHNRNSLIDVVQNLARLRGYSFKELSDKIGQPVIQSIHTKWSEPLMYVFKKLAPYLKFTKNDLKIIDKKSHSTAFLIIHPKDKYSRQNLFNYIQAKIYVHNDTLSSLAKRNGVSYSCLHRNLFERSAISVTFIFNCVPYLSFHKLVALSHGQYAPISDFVYKLQKQVKNRLELLQYLTVIALLKNTSLAKVSQAINRDRTYVGVTTKTGSKSKIMSIMKEIAPVLKVNPKMLLDPCRRLTENHSLPNRKPVSPKGAKEKVIYRNLRLYITVSGYLSLKKVPVTVYSRLYMTPHSIYDRSISNDVPAVSRYDLRLIRAGDDRPVKKALHWFSRRVQGRDSVLVYLDDLCRFYNMNLTQLSEKLGKPSNFLADKIGFLSNDDSLRIAKEIAHVFKLPEKELIVPMRHIKGFIYCVHDRKSLLYAITALAKLKGYTSMKHFSMEVSQTKSGDSLRYVIMQGKLSQIKKMVNEIAKPLDMNEDECNHIIKMMRNYFESTDTTKLKRREHQMNLYVRLWASVHHTTLSEIVNKYGMSDNYMNTSVHHYLMSDTIGQLARIFPKSAMNELTSIKYGNYTSNKKLLNILRSQINSRHQLNMYVSSLLDFRSIPMSQVNKAMHRKYSYVTSTFRYGKPDLMQEVGAKLAEVLGLDRDFFIQPINQAVGIGAQNTAETPHVQKIKDDNPELKKQIARCVQQIAEKSWMSIQTLSKTLYQDPNLLENKLNTGSLGNDIKLLRRLVKISQVSTPLINKVLDNK